jgi:UDPglucose 6-dehydrogenase
MNEIANLCESVEADVDLVRRGIGSDERIGPAFLFPGPGYGGSCFPKDVKALVRTAKEHGVAMQVLDAVESVNEVQKHRMFDKLKEALGGKLKGKRIAVWGLAFKPNTDDMREAPALTLIDDLLDAGASVAAHDPAAMHEAKRRLGDTITFVDDSYDALDKADALCVVTDWNEYRHPDFMRIRQTLRTPVVIDGRNLYSTRKMAELGFVYRSIGRQDVSGRPVPHAGGSIPAEPAVATTGVAESV